jgi:hypothetical protein
MLIDSTSNIPVHRAGGGSCEVPGSGKSNLVFVAGRIVDTRVTVWITSMWPHLEGTNEDYTTVKVLKRYKCTR